MEDAFGHSSGGLFDDILFEFPGSCSASEDPLFALLEPVSAGEFLAPPPSAPATDELRQPASATGGAPSPSSPATAGAAADNKAKRKADQNRRAGQSRVVNSLRCSGCAPAMHQCKGLELSVNLRPGSVYSTNCTSQVRDGRLHTAQARVSAVPRSAAAAEGHGSPGRGGLGGPAAGAGAGALAARTARRCAAEGESSVTEPLKADTDLVFKALPVSWARRPGCVSQCAEPQHAQHCSNPYVLVNIHGHGLSRLVPCHALCADQQHEGC